MIKSLSMIAVVLFAQASLAAVEIPQFPGAIVSVCKFEALNIEVSLGLSKKTQVVDGYEYGSVILNGQVQSKSGQVVKALACNTLNGAYHCAFQVDSNTRLELSANADRETHLFQKAGIVAWRGDSPKAYLTKDCSAAPAAVVQK